jgi:hypothetical protein
MAAAAGLVDPVVAADRAAVVVRAEVVDRAAVGTEVPEVQWAAQPHLGASPAAVRPAVGPGTAGPGGTAVPDTAQVTRPPQPALMERLWLIAPPWRPQKIRRLITRFSGTVLLPTQCYNGRRTGFGAGR